MLSNCGRCTIISSRDRQHAWAYASIFVGVQGIALSSRTGRIARQCVQAAQQCGGHVPQVPLAAESPSNVACPYAYKATHAQNIHLRRFARANGMDRVEYVILDLTPVPHMDSMGAHFLGELNEVNEGTSVTHLTVYQLT